MMRIRVLLLFSVVSVLVACEEKPRTEQQIVIEQPAPALVDSLQLQVQAYEAQLLATHDEIGKAQRQLSRLSKQLQDSIEGTKVPPQIQEETINNYRNKLHEVRQAQAALREWQGRENASPSDSLSAQERKDFLEKQLQQLEHIMQETRQVRQEAQAAMQESDQEGY